MTLAPANRYVRDAELATRFYLGLTKLFRSLGRAGRSIYRVSLTIPPEAPSNVLAIAAHGFVQDFAGDVGSWLVLDESAKGVLHWYGIVVSTGKHADVELAWRRRTGLGAQVHVKKITGQGGPWTTSRFQQNLRRVVAYATKSTPTYRELPHRVVASGKLHRVWTQTAGIPPRTCQLCGEFIAPTLKSNAKYCSPSCRTFAYKRRKQEKAAIEDLRSWPPMEDEIFAATVAGLHPFDAKRFRRRALITEFEFGLEQGEAERRVLDELLEELRDDEEEAASFSPAADRGPDSGGLVEAYLQSARRITTVSHDSSGLTLD